MKNYHYLNTLSILICLLLLSFSEIASAQNIAAQPKGSLSGFDEVKARREMQERHIVESEQPSYMRYLKRKYLAAKQSQSHPVITHNYSHPVPQFSVTGNCPNAGFEDQNFNNWEGGTGYYPNPTTTWTVGIMTQGPNAPVAQTGARHTIITVPPGNNNPANGPVVGYDPIAISPVTGLAEIPMLAPLSGGTSVRLGNADVNAETEYLKYSVAVTAGNTAFYYYFAIVLQDPGHPPGEQPFFKITATDQLGNPIGGACGTYNIDATLAATDSSFIHTSYAGDLLYYRKWQLVGIDLQSYVGQTISIQFQTADCQPGAHFGYAYIDCSCGLIAPTVNYCHSDTAALIVAPDGFSHYQWYGPNSLNPIAGATHDTLVVNNPVVGDTFTVDMTSASGCNVQLHGVVHVTTLNIAQVSSGNSCQGGASGSASVIATGTSAGYHYLWTPGNFTTQSITNMAPGQYHVHIASNDSSCGSVDTLITVGVSPPPVSNATASYCSNALVIGPPGSNYQWYNPSGTAIPGGTHDTLTIIAPVDLSNYSLGYNTPQGCRDSIIYQLQQTFASVVALAGPTCGTAEITFNDPYLTSFTYILTGPNVHDTVPNNVFPLVPLTGLAGGNYTVIADFGNGCTASSQFFRSSVTSTFDTIVQACPGDTLFITPAVPGHHKVYSPSGVLLDSTQNSTIPIHSLVTGIYTDSTRTTDGCYDVSTYHVSQISITTSISTDSNICFHGHTAEAHINILSGPATGNYTYSWTGPGGFSAITDSIDSLPAGTYVCNIRNGNCAKTDTVKISQPLQPTDTLHIDVSICDLDTSAVLHAPNNPSYSDYQWYLNGSIVPGETNDSIRIFNIPDFMHYAVVYNTPPWGCQRKTSIVTRTIPPALFIPKETVNIFSPNGDMNNDYFFPFSSAVSTPAMINYYTQDYQIKIFNRWGELIFESKEYGQGWDGKHKGSNAPQGVYFWTVNYKSRCGTENDRRELKGTVQLVR